jgi:hypothetical protein
LLPTLLPNSRWIAAITTVPRSPSTNTWVMDWSEAGQGDALHDLASLALGHQEYRGDVDLDVIRGWRPRRSLRGPAA